MVASLHAVNAETLKDVGFSNPLQYEAVVPLVTFGNADPLTLQTDVLIKNSANSEAFEFRDAGTTRSC